MASKTLIRSIPWGNNWILYNEVKLQSLALLHRDVVTFSFSLTSLHAGEFATSHSQIDAVASSFRVYTKTIYNLPLVTLRSRLQTSICNARRRKYLLFLIWLRRFWVCEFSGGIWCTRESGASLRMSFTAFSEGELARIAPGCLSLPILSFLTVAELTGPVERTKRRDHKSTRRDHWQVETTGWQVNTTRWQVDMTTLQVDTTTGYPSSKYVVCATACEYRELYGEIADRKHNKKCVNNHLLWKIKFSYLECAANLSLVPIFKPFWRRLVKLFETVTPTPSII